MEPICWLGIAGAIAIGAAICGMLKGSCKGGNSSCGCETKEESAVNKESSPVKESTTPVSGPVSGIDDKKEKAINDLIQ